jgi:hypothetical protein
MQALARSVGAWGSGIKQCVQKVPALLLKVLLVLAVLALLAMQ